MRVGDKHSVANEPDGTSLVNNGPDNAPRTLFCNLGFASIPIRSATYTYYALRPLVLGTSIVNSLLPIQSVNFMPMILEAL